MCVPRLAAPWRASPLKRELGTPVPERSTVRDYARHYVPRTKILVGVEGIEPSASSLSVKCSTTELHTQIFSTKVSRALSWAI